MATTETFLPDVAGASAAPAGLRAIAVRGVLHSPSVRAPGAKAPGAVNSLHEGGPFDHRRDCIGPFHPVKTASEPQHIAVVPDHGRGSRNLNAKYVVPDLLPERATIAARLPW